MDIKWVNGINLFKCLPLNWTLGPRSFTIHFKNPTIPPSLFKDLISSRDYRPFTKCRCGLCRYKIGKRDHFLKYLLRY